MKLFENNQVKVAMFDNHSSPAAIGRRLKILRNAAKLTISELGALAGISNPSISYWENGQINNPIKSKSMAKLLEAFKKSGIEVDEKWLRTGSGDLPIAQNQVLEGVMHPPLPSPLTLQPTLSAASNLATQDSSTQLATILSEEIKLFASLEQAVITKIDHSRLSPYLDKGDWVGGIWQSATRSIEEQICIFFWNEQLHVACLKTTSKAFHFDVFYSKDDNAIQNLFLEKIAPVIRVWR